MLNKIFTRITLVLLSFSTLNAFSSAVDFSEENCKKVLPQINKLSGSVIAANSTSSEIGVLYDHSVKPGLTAEQRSYKTITESYRDATTNRLAFDMRMHYVKRNYEQFPRVKIEIYPNNTMHVTYVDSGNYKVQLSNLKCSNYNYQIHTLYYNAAITGVAKLSFPGQPLSIWTFKALSTQIN